ncbi:MAG TPA: hypothetical protein DCP38_16450 [Acidobacteria bacterium]|nr:hypothetical protein [Acidobacteriota bacterium]
MEGLPCGCVAVAYEARGLGLVLVNVEAKGPLCGATDHQIGRTLTVGEPADLAPAADRELGSRSIEPPDIVSA